MPSHNSKIRVYYEDTDAGGVVYYANYLKYAERARTEMLRSIGVEQTKLKESEGVLFVVRHAEIDLIKPARLDDLLEVTTEVVEVSKASMTMEQSISSDQYKCAEVKVKIACINEAFKPTRIPESVTEKL